MQRRGAFSLLELSIVLVILSLLVGFGVNIGQDAVKGSTRYAMQNKLSIIKQALDAYADHNGYLPCPADPAMLPSNANYGLESRNGTLGCLVSGGVVQMGGAWFGTVPVRNLGLDESYVSDEWGNKLTYAVSNQHVNNVRSYSDNAGTITIRSNTTASPVTLSESGGVPGAGATYVVVSHGKNGMGAYPVNGIGIAASCGGTASLEIENCDRTNGVFYDAQFNEGSQSTTQFDDYVVWGTNLLYRAPVYILPDSCPSGVCEPWCAPCEKPATTPDSDHSQAPLTATVLCAKFITRNLPNCEARCIWREANAPCP